MDWPSRPQQENLLRIERLLATHTTNYDDILTAHLTKPARTLLLVATEREGTTTLGPTSRDWTTVNTAALTPETLDTIRITGWLATNTARQHTNYTLAATHLNERTTP